MKIRRILMTGDIVGGVWTFCLDLASGLAAHGVEVLLATLGGMPSAAQAAEAAALPNLCLLGSDFKLEWMEDPWLDVEKSGRWLMQLETEYSPDVVHLNSFGHGALPWSAPVVLTAHSCVSSWWAAVKGGQLPHSWDRYRGEVSRSLLSAGLVTAPSASMATALNTHYGMDESLCKVIPNGRDISTYGTQAPTKEPFILTAGRLWDEAKNVAAVVRAAPRLSWPVYVAGDARDLALPGCRMLGRLSAKEMTEWQARAAICAAPVRYEPFGLAILEAALSGCALVLGDIPSLRDIWEDAALYVPPEDDDSLRKTLELLIADDGLRERLSRHARCRALTFDVSRMTLGYLDAYKSVVAERVAQCVS